MIIKVIPEEGETIKEVEHKGVKEFFMFGNKSDNDGILIDFHDWTGQYRYLISNLYWFQDVLTEEKKSKGRPVDKEMDFKAPPQSPKGFVKNITNPQPDLRIIDASAVIENENPKTVEQEEAEEVEKDLTLTPSEGAEDK